MKYLLEVLLTTVFLIFLVRILYISQHIPFIGSYYATIFAVLFIYVPVFIMWFNHRRIDFLDRTPSMFLKSILFFVLSAIIIFPPYLLGAHFWMTIVYGHSQYSLVPYPDLLKTIVFQILLIALPEEFFFRGYMQGTLDKVFRKRWKLFGAYLGYGWLLTSFIFAFSHSFVHYQWWHFSIFFPGLLFGWLRERTGTITASILFHAMSNVVSDYVARCYY